MIDTKEWEKVKEYEKFVLFRHKKTGVRECILKIDLIDIPKQRLDKESKWEMEEYKNTNYKNNFIQRRTEL